MNIENLKCCGNCRNRQVNELHGDNCISEFCMHDYVNPSHEICTKWEFDGLTLTERLEK